MRCFKRSINVNYESNIYLSFYEKTNEKYLFKAINNNNIVDISKGELLFKVSERFAKQLITYKDKKFYIILEKDGDKTLLYSGKYESIDNIDLFVQVW